MVEGENDISRTSLSSQIVTILKNIFGDASVSLHQPVFQGNEWEYLKECLDTTHVASAGRFISEFESGLCELTDAKHAVAVVNGTSGLHIALKLVGVQAEDEVLVPALTFVATANAVDYCGALPHFVDAEPRTLGIDAVALREYLKDCTEQHHEHCINRITGRRIRAVVPMHTFGHPCDLEGIMSVAHDYKLVIVEDAAESIGSEYCNQHTGTFGLMGVFSFNGNKTITTGGGGAILTNDKKLAGTVRHLISNAKSPHNWEFRHDRTGYNYRLPNINAALGLAQLEQLPKILKSKRRLYKKYESAFRGLFDVRLIKEPEKCHSNYWLQTILLRSLDPNQRDIVLRDTNNQGFMTRPAWVPLHRLKPYSQAPKMDLACAEALADGLINLPSSIDVN